MTELKKNIKIKLENNAIYFEKGIFFLEGDLNVANLEIEIINFIENLKLKITYYNENQKKLYVDEVQANEKNIIQVPNEVLQVPGKVLIRISQIKNDSILQSKEEIYFYVLKKKTMSC
ncbi:MAG: hypothetical protein WCQ76_05130 [Fusobacterium sp.]